MVSLHGALTHGAVVFDLPKRLSHFPIRYCDPSQTRRYGVAPWFQKHGALPYGVVVSLHDALPYGAVVFDLPKRLSPFLIQYCDPSQTPVP
jgi:hypothetical protein